MIEKGLAAVEDLIATNRDARYCVGSHPSIADCCLVPQLYNARRYECDMAKFPRGARPSSRVISHHAPISARPPKHPRRDPRRDPRDPGVALTTIRRALTSRHLGRISAPSRPHLSRISAPSRPHLGPISAVSRAALAVEAHVSTLKPFADAHPDTQPDAKK